MSAQPEKAPRWTVVAGRTVCFDGVPALSLHRVQNANGNCPVSPIAADVFVHVLAKVLNERP